MDTTFITPTLELKQSFEDRLIEAYVLEAEFMTHEEALKLAIERDARAAQDLIDSINSTLNLEAAVKASRAKTKTGHEENPEVKKILAELGYS